MNRRISLLVPLLIGVSWVPSHLAAQSSWEDIRGMAESQHEIVMLLIKNRQFDRVTDAARPIFKLQFPQEHEGLLVSEAEILTDALLQHNQFEVAHSVLDLAVESVRSGKLRARLLREKAYVYKKEGRDDEALATFEKSNDLIELEKP